MKCMMFYNSRDKIQRRGHWGKLPSMSSAYLFIYLFIYLAALGLCCCLWAFSSCGEQGLLFVAVHGLLIEVASLVAKHGL